MARFGQLQQIKFAQKYLNYQSKLKKVAKIVKH